MAKRVKQRKADVSCAWCGKPLDLWTSTTSTDGLTVCASDCLGAALAAVPEEDRSPRPAETVGVPSWGKLPSVPVAPEELPCGSWFDDIPD